MMYVVDPATKLKHMSAAFDQVKAAIAVIGEAWDVPIPKLEVARRAAARAPAAWTARADSLSAASARARDANSAPIEARNQFRALLDAYPVKAKRLGRVEDPRLEAIFEQAQSVRYTAPTELGQAAQLVRAYQEALSPPQTAVDDAEVKP